MVSGTAFLIKAVLDLVVGDPPSDGLPAWLTSHRIPLMLTNEVLFFAALFLIPAVLALYRSLDGRRRPWAAFGCAVLACAVPMILVLIVIHGRLVYPVYGLDTEDPAIVALLVSLYYGGVHMVFLLLGIALVLLGLKMRHGAFGRTAAVLGVVAGASQLVGAFPWITGPQVSSIAQAAFAAWLLLIGVRLTRLARTGTPDPPPAS